MSAIRAQAKDTFMRSAWKELTLQSALSDPLILSLMAADNVDPVKLESMLRRIAKEIAPRQSPPMEAARTFGAS
jgi:hypothetical protein